MNFTYVDAAVAIVVLLSAYLAWNRGLTREFFAICGWALAALAAFFLAPKLEPLMREIPGIGPPLARSCVISMIASFALIVALGLLILSVFTPVFASIVRDSALAPIDRTLGFLFGVARGVLLLAVAYMIYTALSGDEIVPALENAVSKPMFEEAAALIDHHRPEQMPAWFSERVDTLMAPCNEDGEQGGGARSTGTRTTES